MYGISQHPDTKDYIIVLLDKYYCEKCGKEYTNIYYKWCKPCSINYFKNSFTNWTSGNEIIDDFIQKMQLKIDEYKDITLEWIPYNQFVDVKEIEKDDNNTASIYLALWNDGFLCFNYDKKEWIRKPNIKVTLKYLNNSQNIIDELLSEVWNYYNFS
jgi:ribosomal protein L37AE/L43A